MCTFVFARVHEELLFLNTEQKGDQVRQEMDDILLVWYVYFSWMGEFYCGEQEE